MEGGVLLETLSKVALSVPPRGAVAVAAALERASECDASRGSCFHLLSMRERIGGALMKWVAVSVREIDACVTPKASLIHPSATAAASLLASPLSNR
jgi:hypothetical protein